MVRAEIALLIPDDLYAKLVAVSDRDQEDLSTVLLRGARQLVDPSPVVQATIPARAVPTAERAAASTAN